MGARKCDWQSFFSHKIKSGHHKKSKFPRNDLSLEGMSMTDDASRNPADIREMLLRSFMLSGLSSIIQGKIPFATEDAVTRADGQVHLRKYWACPSAHDGLTFPIAMHARV